MGILPLYIVLLLGFAFVLPILHRAALPLLVASVVLYLAVPVFNFNLPTYPGGRWFHNPFSWQLLFVIGAVAASYAGSSRLSFVWQRWLFRAAIAFIAVSVVAKLALTVDEKIDILPATLVQGIWLFLDKTNLGPLRLLDFLALVVIVVNLVPRDSRLLRSMAAEPVILCGQHSLYIFCLGILLSYLAHLVLVEISHTVVVEFLVSVAGCGIMIAVAAFLHWTKSQARRVERIAGAPQGGE
jgi:hypothetical protein